MTSEVRRCGDHRPGLGREWCHMDGEWCYRDDPCRGCTIVILEARVAALEALEDRVRRMRDAQRRYYKTRDQAALIESKGLERQVDRALAPGAHWTA